jgi:hypothetical protein
MCCSPLVLVGFCCYQIKLLVSFASHDSANLRIGDFWQQGSCLMALSLVNPHFLGGLAFDLDIDKLCFEQFFES